MRVKVEQSHIDSGVAVSACRCPIANALRDATGEQDISVCSKWFVIDGYTVRDIPPEASAFVHGFDLGNPVEPFEFELNWPHGGING